MKELFFDTLWLAGIIIIILVVFNAIKSTISDIKLDIKKKKALDIIKENSNELKKILEEAIEETKEELKAESKEKSTKKTKSSEKKSK